MRLRHNMSALLLSPGTLHGAIERRSAQALADGALQPIETVCTRIDDGGIRFIVRQVSSLARKTYAFEGDTSDTSSTPLSDPFKPYDPALFVADISDTHIALLNKFNVIDHHMLIVTRDFEEQETLLDLSDFVAWLACLAEFNALGFYNGGVSAGASQAHKHMQIVPLPITTEHNDGFALPIEPLIASARASTRASAGTLLTRFPFVHAFAPLAPASGPQAAAAALDCYLWLMRSLALVSYAEGKPVRQAAAYNLLMTQRWMLVVPRTEAHIEGISINALGFAGSLFVRDAVQLETVQRLGPMTLLARVSRPVGHKL
jgi:ATP adenylyltransferase